MNAQGGTYRPVNRSEDQQTSLYRHFAADGCLLYVGISLSWPARTKAHSHQSKWFDQVAKVEIENFPTRGDALDAEREAIKRERPKFNVVHNRAPAKATKARIERPRLTPKYGRADAVLQRIKGPCAIVGPALVYHGDVISFMVAHGELGTAGELTEIVLGTIYPELPEWTSACGSVMTLRRADEITIAEAREIRGDVIRALKSQLQDVQAFDTDLALAVAYATQFPSEKSRQVLDKAAVERGAKL